MALSADFSKLTKITRFEDYFDTQSAQKYLQQFRDRLSDEEVDH